jgi:antitoxin MazE
MDARVQKWGNSLAIRIPKPFASEIGLEEDASVNLTIQDGRLVITPASKPPYRLADLLEGVSPSNTHAERSWGIADGKEAW